ncbi:Lrp/AsnC family transcriptional regulator [Rhodoblastus acidophilus]|uniref:Lrp/AsnC family transcriptional regulator n=1 Tax=Rhodoblastus acidophilus TaxID=1074 RepID=UPI00161B9232|nr:Lrp/AsnC family transcriptional regulator [Rhodoblastus acidophilus]MCW2283441.1 Lrp/AsnC family transcriptional regulator [Rhodoblastus acidophilus]MCW2332235.1 Lrp/AsnC family transcriptional regulator [Rhodoblastus acidophilus]
MDRIDLHILKILQEDATVTVADISARVALSATPCWKRIQKLETLGILRKRVALLCPAKVGLGLTVHISIQAGEHSTEKLEAFVRAVAAMPEVLEFSRLAGEVDYALKVVTTDISAYDAFYKRLTAIMPLRSVTSRFELQQIKSTTALPLDLAPDAPVAENFSRQPERVIALRPV